ncbi:MAG: response regulator [Pseudomonadales bacterium]
MFNHILVVDDQRADHLLAEYAISDYNANAEIYKAFDGKEALEVLSQQPQIELILLDINMPRMNGHDFLKQYATSCQHSSVVVMLTSSDQKADRERCEQYEQVIAYLSKPLEAVDIKNLEAKSSR